eukprot:1706693-Prorocentrum_lima.AAC.1
MWGAGRNRLAAATAANREPIHPQTGRQRLEKKAAVVTKMITAGSVSRANAVVFRKNPPVNHPVG